jgi:Zn-dependent protease with chaperone function
MNEEFAVYLRKRARSGLRAAWLIRGYLVLLFLFSGARAITQLLLSESWVDTLGPALTLGCLTIGGILIGRGIWRHLGVVQPLHAMEVGPSCAIELHTLVQKLINQMELPSSCFPVRTLIDISSYGVDCSVRSHRTGSSLIVSLGLLKLEPSAARAILAHELAHLAHKDSNTWMFTVYAGRYLTKVVVPVNVATGFLAIILIGGITSSSGTAQVGYFVLMVFGFALSLGVPSALLALICWQRRRVELLADAKALAYVGLEAMQRVLSQVPNDWGPFASHPRRKTRVKSVQRLAARFALNQIDA